MSGPSTYFRQSGELALIGNDRIELAFDLSSGGSLVAVLDKASEHQFLRDATAPRALFRLGLRPAGEQEVAWLDSRQAARCVWQGEETEDGGALVLQVSGFADRPTSVSVRVSLDAGSAFSLWRVRVIDPGTYSVPDSAQGGIISAVRTISRTTTKVSPALAAALDGAIGSSCPAGKCSMAAECIGIARWRLRGASDPWRAAGPPVP